MEVSEIIKFELDEFKNGWGSTVDFSQINKNTVKKALSKALGDAFAMAVKRFKTTYLDIEDQLFDCFIDDYFQFATKEINGLDKLKFDVLFYSLMEKFINQMNILNRPMFATVGFAQKFVSMSFKYLYCFDNTVKQNFRFCKMPLDKYTINWYKKYGNSEYIEQFNKRFAYSWAKINDLIFYKNIQDDIDAILNKGIFYPINCKDDSIRVRLPENKLEVEFIVWSQERLNEVYKDLKKFEHYFDRLGI